LIFAVDTASEVGNSRTHERAHRLAKKPWSQIGRAEIAAWHFQRAELRRYIVPSLSPGEGADSVSILRSLPSQAVFDQHRQTVAAFRQEAGSPPEGVFSRPPEVEIYGLLAE
jgi:hypothetical protein